METLSQNSLESIEPYNEDYIDSCDAEVGMRVQRFKLNFVELMMEKLSLNDLKRLNNNRISDFKRISIETVRI